MVPATNPSVTDALRRLNQELPDAARILRVLMYGNNNERDVDEVLAWLQRTIGPFVDRASPSSPAQSVLSVMASPQRPSQSRPGR